MLNDFERADRMAIPLPFIQAVGQPRAAAYMAALCAWRFTKAVYRDAWYRQVITLRAPAIARGPISSTSGSNASRNASAFFDGLLHKCLNLYGAGAPASDPLAQARHP